MNREATVRFGRRSSCYGAGPRPRARRGRTLGGRAPGQPTQRAGANPTAEQGRTNHTSRFFSPPHCAATAADSSEGGQRPRSSRSHSTHVPAEHDRFHAPGGLPTDPAAPRRRHGRASLGTPALSDQQGGLLITGSPIICGMAGDQQASLVGQGCTRPGLAKATFGTGGMLDQCTGPEGPPTHAGRGRAGTFPIVAYRIGGKSTWGVEAVMLSAGTCVEWLRDDLGLLSTSEESAAVAAQCETTGDVWFVPALLGMGTPVWDFGAHGALVGLTRGPAAQKSWRVVLEGVAHRGADLVKAAEADSGFPIHSLRIDGGMSDNDVFVNALADAIGRPVEVSPGARGHHPRRRAAGRPGHRVVRLRGRVGRDVQPSPDGGTPQRRYPARRREGVSGGYGPGPRPKPPFPSSPAFRSDGRGRHICAHTSDAASCAAAEASTSLGTAEHAQCPPTETGRPANWWSGPIDLRTDCGAVPWVVGLRTAPSADRHSPVCLRRMVFIELRADVCRLG